MANKFASIPDGRYALTFSNKVTRFLKVEQGKGKWAHLRVSRSRDLGGDFFMARNAGKTVGGRFRSLNQALKALGL